MNKCYVLRWNAVPEKTKRIRQFIQSSKNTWDGFEGINVDGTNNTDREHEWYECDEHVQFLSETFPDVLFVLDVYDVEHLWRLYATDGKYYVADADIIWPEYNEDKLQ